MQPNSTTTAVVKEEGILHDIISTTFKIYTTRKLLIYRESGRDLYVPLAIFLTVAGIFLLLGLFVPVTKDPTSDIYVAQILQLTGDYLQEHGVFGLFAHFWACFIVFGGLLLFFTMLVHRDDTAEIIYVMGMVLMSFSIFLMYILIRFLIGIILVKFATHMAWLKWLINYEVFSIPLLKLVLALFLVPLLHIIVEPFKALGARGTMTLILFTVNLFATGAVYFRFYQPLPINSQSVFRNTSPAGKFTDSLKAVANYANDSLLIHVSRVDKNKFLLSTETTIRNIYSDSTYLPFHRTIGVNMIIDTIALLTQDEFLSRDFVFNMHCEPDALLSTGVIPPNGERKILLSKQIDKEQYQYFANKFERNKRRPLWVNLRFNLEKPKYSAKSFTRKYHLVFEIEGEKTYGTQIENENEIAVVE